MVFQEKYLNQMSGFFSEKLEDGSGEEGGRVEEAFGVRLQWSNFAGDGGPKPISPFFSLQRYFENFECQDFSFRRIFFFASNFEFFFV